MFTIEQLENKIFCEDSYKFVKKIPDKSIDCIYTDIPYLITSGGGGSSPLAHRIVKNKEALKGFRDKQEQTQGYEREGNRIKGNIVKNKTNINDLTDGIDYKIFDDFVRIMKKINIFIWCSKMQIHDIMNYFNALPNVNMEILMWGKTNAIPATNNVWLPDVEYCLYFREKGVKLNDGYELKSKYYISPINKSDKDIYDHPTIKPLELVERHIKHATQENDIVLDTFLGSGTTAHACKNTNRRYIGLENDEEYYNIAVDRLNGVTVVDRKLKDKGVFDMFEYMEENE